MSKFSAVTDAELARARSDRVFRQRLLEQSLEVLLAEMKKMRGSDPFGGVNVRQLREGVELAVRLAELIQNAGSPARRY
jgi:hypothetical protein